MREEGDYELTLSVPQVHVEDLETYAEREVLGYSVEQQTPRKSALSAPQVEETVYYLDGWKQASFYTGDPIVIYSSVRDFA